MFGGVVSALIVGFILERGDLYANIVADSYAQGGDEEFWKGLSEEEKVKVQAMMDRANGVKNNNGGDGEQEATTVMESNGDGGEGSTIKARPKKEDEKKVKASESADMFSDYGD